MKLFNTGIKGKDHTPKKHSLIRIIYIYPVIFFLVGLSVVTAYYTWLQINKYKSEVEKLKTEFPEKQKAELKSRVLFLKDYIYWVKSHPEEYTIQWLKNRVNATETILNGCDPKEFLNIGSVPERISYSLDELNTRSITKVILLNDKKEVLFPNNSLKYIEGYNASKNISKEYKLNDLIYADSLIRKSYRNEICIGMKFLGFLICWLKKVRLMG